MIEIKFSTSVIHVLSVGVEAIEAIPNRFQVSHLNHSTKSTMVLSILITDQVNCKFYVAQKLCVDCRIPTYTGNAQ